MNELKSSNVALGYHNKKTNTSQVPDLSAKFNRGTDAVNREIGETTKMYSYVQRRGFASNVLPLNSNAATTKPLNAHVAPENKSTNQSTFKWNNFKV